MKKDWLEATQAGNCKVVISLIDKGADINALDKHGQTALMNAARQGDASLAKELADQGADLDHTAKYNLTALMLAVINDHKEIVNILVKAGANTELKGSEGSFEYSPLEYAIKHGNDEIASILQRKI